MAGERVLVIDDVGFNRIVLIRILSKEGYLVDEAENGPSALKLLSRKRYDLVISDLIMPEMDGMQVIQEAYSRTFFDDNGEIPKPPFILCSAFLGEEVFDQAINAGYLDVVAKPVVRERMLESIEKILKGSGANALSLQVVGAAAQVLNRLSKASGLEPREIVDKVLIALPVGEIEKGIRPGSNFRHVLESVIGHHAEEPAPDQ
jgi:two-component system response regulator ResD